MSTAAPPRRRIAVVEPVRGWALPSLRELLPHGELAYFLVWRDVKVRYKQAVLGVAWVAIQPLVMMGVFTFVFDRLANVPSQGVPYPVFTLSGLLPWLFLSTSVNSAATSVVANANLVTKVYFPRLVLPLAAIAGRIPDLLVGLGLMLVVMASFGIAPRPTMLLVPLLVVHAAAIALTIATFLAAANVAYRDVQHALPFALQVWLFLTPVVYPASLVPEALRDVYALNPAVAIVSGFRWAILGSSPPPIAGWLWSTVFVLMVLPIGLVFFHRAERSFADVV